MGIVLSFIFSGLSVGYTFYKGRILNKNRVQRSISFGISYLLKILVMFIVMSMNAWVCLAVITGMTAGQIFFQKVTLKAVKEHILES